MADLIAQGPRSQDRWRHRLPAGSGIAVGRAPGGFEVPWDDRVSRRHAELRWEGDRLYVKKLAQARNPIFYQGQESDAFAVAPGEHFVIGQTTFTVVDHQIAPRSRSRDPDRQQTFSPQYLQQLQFRNARARIEVLARLPEVIRGAGSTQELLARLTSLLISGIPRSDAVALVRVGTEGEDAVEIFHWDRRLLHSAPFEPSTTLIRQAVGSGESVLHIWGSGDESSYTVRENVDWAFCTPVPGEVCRGWAIYVAGRFQSLPHAGSGTDPTDLRDDLKFTEVAAATLESLEHVQQLQRQHAAVEQFFSPVVLAALEGEDPQEALTPRETEVTVMFCDLRGFSRHSEQSAGDLLGLLDRVSKALGVVTHEIRALDGVVGDFQGDAVMGFWGWPIATEDAARRACLAALNIRRQLEQAARDRDNPLSGFRLGIGLASGNAVAGKIGTVDQVKVTVIGPVVNLASRLESMTKTLRVPILIDKATADYVRSHVPPEVSRCRRLAVVRPAGMDSAVEVSELLPPVSDAPAMPAGSIADYEAALEAFIAGDWEQAFAKLHEVPADDRAKDFLTSVILQHNRTAPEDWDGVLQLSSK